jgi:hypothetical protein
MWMPLAPTIHVAGVRIGTDKLAHVVSSGWIYYQVYRKAIEKGHTSDEAERRAVRRGLLEESMHLGGRTSGIQAIADIEASYGGLRLYRDLCDTDDPLLRLEGGGWIVSRPIDLRHYVTPRWDESYQPAVFGRGRWRKVKPVLESYCERLDDPNVVALRRRYRERDKGSVVSEMVAERVAAGTLADPAQFGIEAVCPQADPSLAAAAMLAKNPSLIDSNGHATNGHATRMEERLVEEEGQRRRFALGLAGAKLTYPQWVSASISVMLTSQPSSYDCRTPCEFRGPFAQLEPGLSGGKLSLGWGSVKGNTNRAGSFLTAAHIGLTYELVLFRTWSDLGPLEAGQTFAGPEIGLLVAGANLGLGVLYRVHDGPDGPWLVTAGVGWGF